MLALQPTLDAVGPDDAFAGERQARLDELDRTLRGQGWRRAGHGAHWWSRRYVRPPSTGTRPPTPDSHTPWAR